MISDGDFWNDQASAQETMREKNRLERQLAVIDALQLEMDDAIELLELGTAEGDEEIIDDAEASLSKLVAIAEKRSSKACYLARLMRMTVLSKFTLVLVERRHRIGL